MPVGKYPQSVSVREVFAPAGEQPSGSEGPKILCNPKNVLELQHKYRYGLFQFKDSVGYSKHHRHAHQYYYLSLLESSVSSSV